MKNCMIDPMGKTLSGLLDNLENEAEYMECINDEVTPQLRAAARQVELADGSKGLPDSVSVV